jgi:hypothetical protein
VNLRTLSIITIALISLNACATREKSPRPHNWALAVQNAETRENHEALAKHYDEVSQEMLADAEEEKAMLEQYQAKPHKYGKSILDLKARATAMIRDFELASEESKQMADYHRQLAAESE